MSDPERHILPLMVALLLVLTVVAAPPIADAAGPEFENYSPSNGAAVAISPYLGVKVEFTCPTYYEYPSYGGERKRDWLDYQVVLASRPFVGEFGGLPIYGSVLISGIDTCSVKIPSYKLESGATYYWRVRRTNNEVIGGYEYDEPTSFVTYTEESRPTTPTNPTTPTAPSGGGGGNGNARVTVWTGCGLSSHTAKSSTCGPHAKLGAFIKTSKDSTYTICVRFPEGERLCTERPQEAEAGTTYVNRITSQAPGRYKITWNVEGRRFTRYLRRTR